MFWTTLVSLILAAGPPAEVVVVNIPTKSSVSVVLTPSGKADIERIGTLSQIHIEVDKLQPPQKLSPAMNAYVVWAVSPEGGFENLGEMAVVDGKGRMDTSSRFDQLGILITAEPHFMVDRPNSVIAFRNQPPKSDNVRHVSVSVDVGAYDYSKLQPITATIPGLAAQARAALALAAGVQADRYAEADYRLARVDLGTLEDMLGRSTPMDLILPIAGETIRLAQKSYISARENVAASALEVARNDAALLKSNAQQLQDRLQQANKDLAAAMDQARDRQQATADRDAALSRVQGLEKDLADLRRKQDESQNVSVLRLTADSFDIATGGLTPSGVDAVAKIAATAGFWTSPMRIACPGNAVEILKRFLFASGVAENRVVIVADR